MKKISIEIQLRADDIDREKFYRMIENAGEILIGGATAFFEGNYDEESMEQVDKDFPLKVKLLGGRKRIMLGEAFSSYLSEPLIPVKDQEKIVSVFNDEYSKLIGQNSEQISVGASMDKQMINNTNEERLLKEIEKLRREKSILNGQVQSCRNYLMEVKSSEIKVEDALEALGFGRNGLNYNSDI